MDDTILIKPSTPHELQLVLLILKHLKIQSEVLEGIKEKDMKQTKKGVNTLKYCGTVKFAGDPVKLQNSMRDEWR